MNSSNSGKWPKVGSARSERRKRTNYTREQVACLTEAFEANPYPGYEARERLARQIGIPEARIHVWFQNRRARQPRLLNPGESEESSRQDPPSEPQLPPDSQGYPPLAAGPVWGDPQGGNRSFLGHPQTFQPLEGSQEASPSTLPVPAPMGPAPPVLQSSWDASASSGSGLVRAVPQPTQQRPVLQPPLDTYSYHPYQPQETPQLPGDPFYAPQPYSCPDPALGLHGDSGNPFYAPQPYSCPDPALGPHGESDLEGALDCLAQGSVPGGNMPQPAFYGKEAVNLVDW